MAKGDKGNIRKVFKVSLKLMACVGLILAVMLFMAAGWLVQSGIIKDGRAYYALVALIPAVFFATILASFRGFFQGHQLMTPPAVSQIIEQFVRVVTMVVLAYVLLPYGLEYAAAGAAFGAAAVAASVAFVQLDDTSTVTSSLKNSNLELSGTEGAVAVLANNNEKVSGEVGAGALAVGLGGAAGVTIGLNELDNRVTAEASGNRLGSAMKQPGCAG